VKVTVLGSGSGGNAVAVTADDTTILLDAGFSLRALRQRAHHAEVDLSRLAAVFLTHEHQDHACGGRRLASAAKCPLYASPGTLGRLKGNRRRDSSRVIAHLETVSIGPFEVSACRTIHDAAEPLALSVTGPDGEKLALAYDLGRATPTLRYLLRAADCLILEFNHDESMLRASPYPPSVRRRIAGPEGHLSNRAGAELLAAIWHRTLETVVLAHVSEICNRKGLAEEVARESLARRGYGGELLVAEQDIPLATFEVRGD
jgi:phosphoribosyl 1,2-cyclic phosphodiesterase